MVARLLHIYQLALKDLSALHCLTLDMPQREERIKRNNAILEQLGVRTAAQKVAAGQRRKASQQRKPKAAIQSIIRKCARLRKDNQTALKKENLKALESGKLGLGIGLL